MSTTASFPRRGIGGSLTLRGGAEGVGSDATFAQVHARASWFQGLGARNRLIVRGETRPHLHRCADRHAAEPALLRRRRPQHPRLRIPRGRARASDTDHGEFSVGAKNVLTASGEFEHYFNDSWGGAAFVDSGSAFDGSKPDWRTGVGVGVRWRSPVGPVRFDIAHGLDHPDSPFTIGLSIGADL